MRTLPEMVEFFIAFALLELGFVGNPDMWLGG
jgi:hypothetical protein